MPWRPRKEKRMKKYRLYATGTYSKYLGEVEAENVEEAEEMGWNHDECGFTLCHRCAREAEFDDVNRIEVEIVDD
jgi:hypothetical protein